MILGIDPGASGALALIDGTHIIEIWDMPTYTRKVGKTERQRVSLPGLLDTIDLAATIGAQVAWVEDVGGRGNQTGSSVFGYNVGIIHMALVAAKLRFELIPPGAWKRKFRLSDDKAASVEKAENIFSGQRDIFRGPKGGKLDGRAEAALIAYYGGLKP